MITSNDLLTTCLQVGIDNFLLILEMENILMNRNILKAAAIAIPMMLGTAIADEMQPAKDVLNGVVPMNSSELAVVTGGFFDFKSCAFCGNWAAVSQNNISVLSAFVSQRNRSSVNQSNN